MTSVIINIFLKESYFKMNWFMFRKKKAQNLKALKKSSLFIGKKNDQI